MEANMWNGLQINDGSFIVGLAPVQMLVELSLISGLFVFLFYLFGKYGVRINKLLQAGGLLALSIVYFKYRVSPPVPFSVIAIYTLMVGIGILLWVSATETSWREFCRPIFAVMDGSTVSTKAIRVAVVVILPFLVGIWVLVALSPRLDEPMELRINHPNPPAKITVHGVTYDLQTAKNPFRVDQ
jgi:hypothetical protein